MSDIPAHDIKKCPKCEIVFNLCELQIIDSCISDGVELTCFNCGEILVVGIVEE